MFQTQFASLPSCLSACSARETISPGLVDSKFQISVVNLDCGALRQRRRPPGAKPSAKDSAQKSRRQGCFVSTLHLSSCTNARLPKPATSAKTAKLKSSRLGTLGIDR